MCYTVIVFMVTVNEVNSYFSTFLYTGVLYTMMIKKKRITAAREFDSWISEKSTCRSHKTCFFCVKFLVFIYCILLQCVVRYNKGGILHASYYIEI